MAGVSLGTVHRALYGKPGVGDRVREKILAIVEGSNYRVNEAASMLKRGDLAVSVVLPAPQREERYYLRGIWEGVREAACRLERFRIHFDFVEARHRLDKMALSLKELYDSRADGIQGLITVADTPEADEWVSRFSRRGVPVILVSSCEKDAKCLASVKVDHRVCGWLAADHLSLAARDRKGKILFLSGQSDSYSNWLYARSFEERLAENGGGHEIIRVEGLGRSAVADECRKIVERERLAGIFTLNARNTILLCEMLENMPKTKKPFFVGCDVFKELIPHFESGILDASVYQFHREQGERAVTLMYEHLFGNGEERDIVHLPAILAFRSNYRFFLS